MSFFRPFSFLERLLPLAAPKQDFSDLIVAVQQDHCLVRHVCRLTATDLEMSVARYFRPGSVVEVELLNRSRMALRKRQLRVTGVSPDGSHACTLRGRFEESLSRDDVELLLT